MALFAVSCEIESMASSTSRARAAPRVIDTPAQVRQLFEKLEGTHQASREERRRSRQFALIAIASTIASGAILLTAHMGGVDSQAVWLRVVLFVAAAGAISTALGAVNAMRTARLRYSFESRSVTCFTGGDTIDWKVERAEISGIVVSPMTGGRIMLVLIVESGHRYPIRGFASIAAIVSEAV